MRVRSRKQQGHPGRCREEVGSAALSQPHAAYVTGAGIADQHKQEGSFLGLFFSWTITLREGKKKKKQRKTKRTETQKMD